MSRLKSFLRRLIGSEKTPAILLDRPPAPYAADELKATPPFEQTLETICPALIDAAQASGGGAILVVIRSSQAIVLIESEARRHGIVGNLAGIDLDTFERAIASGSITEVLRLRRAGSVWRAEPLAGLLDAIRAHPEAARAWLQAALRTDVSRHDAYPADYFGRLAAIVREIDLVDFLANAAARDGTRFITPFDEPDSLPRLSPANPRRRSAVFLRNSYYHFKHLGEGLSARGWDVMTVAFDAHDTIISPFLHGADINLYDADYNAMREKSRAFFRTVSERFEAFHFYGMGYPSLFIDHTENSEHPNIVPWDLMEMRRHRMVIGYMPGGCLDGGLQTSIHALSGGVCDQCNYQTQPEVCNDARSLAWNLKLKHFCDWISLECDYATEERIDPKFVYGPVVTALDKDRWSPDIDVPDDLKINRGENEIIIYHAFGNYKERAVSGRDIKGTGTILSTIDHLKAEGLPVRLFFAHDIPSTQVRFLQVQADIVIDQLHYGRYGANARECMMLGRPTIGHLSSRQASPLPSLRPIDEVPIVRADVGTIADVLRALVLDPERRALLGRETRRFAIAWHGKEACAERYERVIDRIRAGLPPETPDLYPTSLGYS